MPRSRATAAAILALFVLVVAGTAMAWVRATLTSDAVRASLASQVSRALGQPVSIGAIALVIHAALRALGNLGGEGGLADSSTR